MVRALAELERAAVHFLEVDLDPAATDETLAQSEAELRSAIQEARVLRTRAETMHSQAAARMGVRL